ncbi:MAG TPA: 4Fe-4S binding protein [Thermoplasmata archaeon]|nr:4Fe-4S binding protein [Thermoplasmata archaeon]
MAERKLPKSTGIVLKPMKRTGKQLVRTLILGKPNTVLYPEQKLVLPQVYRGKQVLDFKKCIGCGNCVTICPNDCMWLEKVDDPELGKIERPGVDIGRCLFCGLCAEVCPTVALHMTTEYELANSDRDKLRLSPMDIRDDNFGFTFVEERTTRMLPTLDLSKCTGCEKCAGECPEMCIAMMPVDKTDRNKPEIHLAKCTSHGKCAAVCPEKALTMTEVYESYFEMPEPKLILDNCSGCGACARKCPSEAIYMIEMPGTEKTLKDGKKGKPKKRAVFILEKCVGCGRCYQACKFEAIEMPGVNK